VIISDIAADVSYSGDETRRHLVANLLDNAVRHAPADTRVGVARGEWIALRLSVSDNGGGGTRGSTHFDRFVKLDSAHERRRRRSACDARWSPRHIWNAGTDRTGSGRRRSRPNPAHPAG
jgi:signal transduction histidine kinase